MTATVRMILLELAAPLILLFPGLDAFAGNSFPFRLYCDASLDGVGATLDREQPGGFPVHQPRQVELGTFMNLPPPLSL